MTALVVTLVARLVGWYWRQVRRCWWAVVRRMTPVRGPDRHLARLQAWRSWLGYASVVVAVAVTEDASVLGGLAQGAVVGFAVKAAVAVPVFLVAAVVLALRTHPSQRWARLTPAVRPFTLVLAVCCLPMLAFVGSELSARQPPGRSPGLDVTAELALGVLVLLGWPFLAAAVLAVLVHGVRHLFCSGDVHPLLPSVLASVVAVVSGVENARGATDPGTPGARVLSLLALGGSVVVLGLTAYEHRRLRRAGWRWSDIRMAAHELPPGHPLRRDPAWPTG